MEGLGGSGTEGAIHTHWDSVQAHYACTNTGQRPKKRGESLPEPAKKKKNNLLS